MTAILAFLLSPIGRWIVGAVTAISIVGGSATWLSVHEYNKGYAAAIAKIAARDKEATNAVKKAISNVDDCVAHNGVWDTVNGVCS